MSTSCEVRQIDVDYLLTKLKPKGFFQIAQYCVLALTFMEYAASLFKIIFMGILPEVKCAVMNETQLLEYGYEDNSSFVIKYEKCHIEVQSRNGSSNQTLPCVNGYSYVPERSRSFVSEFDLVCDKEGFSELTQTLYSVGCLVSSFIIPIITDKYGRKPIHIILSLLLLGTGIGLSFSPNYWTFVALRSVEGFMNQGMIGPSFTMMLELIPAKQRTVLAASTGIIWGVGVVSLAPLAYIFHMFSWRINSLAFTALSGIVFFEIWYIEESLRWLLTNGKIEKSKRIIRRAAKENGVNFDDVWCKCIEPSIALLPAEKDGFIEEEKEQEVIPQVSNVGITTLFKDRTARKISIVVLINGLMNSLTYNMIYMTAAQLSGNYYLNYFLTALMEIVANVIMFFMLMRLERRTTMVFFQFLSGVALVLAVIINLVLKDASASATAKVILTLIGMFGISASYCVIWLYVPEIYPTNLRNIGIGMLGISGAIGNMISPFSRVVVLYIPWLPSTVFGAGSILSSLLIFTLPESRGQQMPTTMDEIRSWKEKRKEKKLALKNNQKNGSVTIH